MTQLTRRERVDAALRGQPVDRVPVSAWHHFIPEERTPDTLADISLRFFKQYDWDWLKVNPRSTYYAEAWGNEYDFDTYDGVRPRFVSGPVAGPADLAKVTPRSPTEGVFEEHLNLLQRIQQGIGDAHFIQTIFSPLSVLSYMIARPEDPTQTRQARYDALHTLMHEAPEDTHAALAAIAETLAGYAAACVDTGASGIFFAIVKLAREGVLTPEEHTTFGRPYDLHVLSAVQDAPMNVLHQCGPHAYFDLVADYPVHAINWATVNQDNPTLAEGKARTSLAVIGGVDEDGVLQTGRPEEVNAAAQEAIRSTGGERMLLAPGCATQMDVPAANLHALRRATEQAA
jgi:uroporphyrinogen decarboxylase